MDEPRRYDLRFEWATAADDAELRRLLRDTAMPGALTITMEREPCFFHGAGVEGDRHDTVVARLPDDPARLVGLGSRAELRAFVNGEARPLGYFSQVRVEPGFRGGREVLQGGFGKLHALHRTRDTTLYATTIIADNHRARRALASGWPGLPTYREREVLRTLAIPVFRGPDLTTSRCTLRPARASDLPEIVACLQQHHRQFQIAPVIDADVLTSPTRSRGLRVEDFVVALRGKRLVGCVALWNQLGFKQLVVKGYRGPLRVTRTLVNALAPVLGIPRLPSPGSPFQFAFLAHLAADPADDELWVALVRAGCARAFESGLGYVSVGLTERHPQSARLARAFRHVEYRSIVYVAHWDDGAAAADRLDDRPGHLEIAML